MTVVLDTLAAGDLAMVREIVVPVSLQPRCARPVAAVGRAPGRRPSARVGTVPSLAGREPARRRARAGDVEHGRRPAARRSGRAEPTSTPRSCRRPRSSTTRCTCSPNRSPTMPPPSRDSSSSAVPVTVPRRPAPTRPSLVVHLPDNEAGALLTMLEQFATRGVNLSRIESRPIGDELGRYLFSIDAEGHIAEARMAEALMGLHRVCPVVRFLGSYPKADGVPNDVRAGTAERRFRRVRGGGLPTCGLSAGEREPLTRAPRPARGSRAGRSRTGQRSRWSPRSGSRAWSPPVQRDEAACRPRTIG